MKKGVFTFFLQFILIVSLSCFSSCKKTSGPVSSSSEEPEEPKKLVLLTWDQYFAPEVIESFQASTGISVELAFYENLGEMMGLLRSNSEGYDVVITDDPSIPILAELKLISELDHSQLPNKRRILTRYLDRPIDPANRYTIPYVWGTTLVAYRTDRIPDPIQSWDILWDPALKGRVAMMDERADIYAAALLKSNHSLNSQDPGHLEEATELLLEQIRDFDPVYTDVITARDLMLKGEIWAMITYSCDAAALAEEGENIGYFIPEEGAPIWMDSFAIPKLAPNKDCAHAFIDYLCRPEVAAANANYIRYIPPVEGTELLLDADLAADLGLNPPLKIVEKCESLLPATIEREVILNQGMKRLFDQIRATKMAKNDDGSPTPAESGTTFAPSEEPSATFPLAD